MRTDWDGQFIQEYPNVFRDCHESEITLKKLIRLVHGSTEELDISIVRGSYKATEGVNERTIPNYLVEDVFDEYGFDFDNNPKIQRILKYYGDCPCWNMVAKWKNTYTGKGLYPCLEVHIHFRDIRAAWIQEQEDIKKEKARQRRLRQKSKGV